MEKQMKKGEKLLFASGDFFGGGAQALISVLYLIFLTDVIGINPAWAALAILISKIWDAVSDPLMGVISDNARTPFGRRRPFIFLGGLLIILAFAVMWMPAGGWQSNVGKFAFAIGAYLFYCTVSTIILVPYSSLSAEITTDTKERNSVNILRLVISTVATAVCTLVPSIVLEAYKGGSITMDVFYMVVGIGFGVLFAIPLVLIGIFTKERVKLSDHKSVFHVKTFIKPLKVKAFRGLVYMYLAQSMAMDILGTGIIYYALYVAKGSSTVFLGIFIGVQLLLFPVVNAIINKVDKKKIYYMGLPLAIVSFIGVGIYPSAWPTIGAYILTGFTAIGFAGAQLMSWIIFPDAVDAGELVLGERNTGSFSGIMTFTRKTASAIAIQLFGIMLTVFGYVKPTETIALPDQPASALLGIRLAMTVSFVILATAGFFIARKYVLTHQISERIRHMLQLKEEKELNAFDESEKREYDLLLLDIT